jgi:hypothetical protein
MKLENNPRFFAVMIDHYSLRIQDPSVPLFMKMKFAQTLSFYKQLYHQLTH